MASTKLYFQSYAFDLYINDLIKVSLTFSQQSLIAYAGDLIIISKDLN